jgi:NAD(P)-dependent dehydrogenase (short-subunit alcohol dehydrogenase family)
MTGIIRNEESIMKLDNAVVLITGANRGLGLAFAREALKRGAKKVYAGARDPASVRLAGVEPVQLDVTNPADIAAAAAKLGDVTLVINNAGIAEVGGFFADGAIESAQRTLDVNYYGPWRVSQAFAPILARNGGGAILNVLSIVSFISSAALAVYSSSKSAAWSLTNALRNELSEQKTQVLGLHVGYIDTDLTRGFDVPKIAPEAVVASAYDALEAGQSEVLVDELTRAVKQGMTAEPPVYLQAR